eukprot:gene14512-20541_t
MLDLLDPLELFAEESLIPSTFKYGAEGLGKSLDPGGNEKDLAAESKVEIPLWLLQPLSKRGMVTFKMPLMYSDRYKRKLNAGAEVVSFKNKAPFFYEASASKLESGNWWLQCVGIKCNAFLHDVELSEFLTRTFKVRYQELISTGLNTMTGEQVLELQSKLSNEEQQLFEGGRVSIASINRWLRDDYAPQKSFKILALRRKRTAADGDMEVPEEANKR